MENGVDAGFPAEAAIPGESARVAGEIFVGAELRGIDENAGDYGARAARQFARVAHEGDMAVMEGAHGGNQHQVAGRTPAELGGTGGGADDFHG